MSADPEIKNTSTHRQSNCMCLRTAAPTSIFRENVEDMATTLGKIMIVCRINPRKVKSAIDLTVHFLLRYDEVYYCLYAQPKRKLRKKDLFEELAGTCKMCSVTAPLAYEIIKHGFKAFYYKPTKLNVDDPGVYPFYSNKCVYMHAAKKTTNVYARYSGLTCEQKRGLESQIKMAYEMFYDRMHERMVTGTKICKCCLCTKKRESTVFDKPYSCGTGEHNKQRCPHCSNQLEMDGESSHRPEPKCPICHRTLKLCTCEKREFSMDWVKSIWNRPDMREYYRLTIKLGIDAPCQDWFDPFFLKHMIGPTAVDCAEWFDPSWLKPFEKLGGFPGPCDDWFDPTYLKHLSGRTAGDCSDWIDPTWLKYKM